LGVQSWIGRFDELIVELKKARHLQPCLLGLLGLCGGAPEKEAHARVTGDDNPQMMFRIKTLLESGCAVAHDVGQLYVLTSAPRRTCGHFGRVTAEMRGESPPQRRTAAERKRQGFQLTDITKVMIMV